jgi:hypothetical protein
MCPACTRWCCGPWGQGTPRENGDGRAQCRPCHQAVIAPAC